MGWTSTAGRGRKAKGFGYAIDYDKAIAQDEREIARFERRLATAQLFTEADFAFDSPVLMTGGSGAVGQVRGVSLLGFLAVEETRLPRWTALTGGTLEDLQHAMDYAEERLPGLALGPDVKDWYSRGKAFLEKALARFGTETAYHLILSVELERNGLRAAKASLARHRRNKEKHGKRN